jgi:hypothetical protein
MLQSKATNSVRSVVTNITETHPLVSKDIIFDALTTHFVLTYKDRDDMRIHITEVDEEEMLREDGVDSVVARFKVTLIRSPVNSSLGNGRMASLPNLQQRYKIRSLGEKWYGVF